MLLTVQFLSNETADLTPERQNWVSWVCGWPRSPRLSFAPKGLGLFSVELREEGLLFLPPSPRHRHPPTKAQELFPSGLPEEATQQEMPS